MSKLSSTEWLLSQNKYENSLESVHYQTNIGSRKATTISVSSGKGGVGKTTSSILLAKNLANNGFKTLLVDCDFNLSNTAVKLGLPLNNDFYNFATQNKKFEDCVYKEGNFHLLTSCNGSLDMFNNDLKLDQLIIDVIIKNERKYDYIILDCPAGVQKKTLGLCAYADLRFVIVTPEKSSITDSYSLMKILSKNFGTNNFHILLNKISHDKQKERIVNSISDTVDRFLSARLSFLGSVIHDKNNVDEFDRVLENNSSHPISVEFSQIVKKFVEEDISTMPQSSIWNWRQSQLKTSKESEVL